ncbi:MAG: aminomethyl-transferring glycine dehydrogenase subunit GcvPA [Bacteroidetes bacterium]|nr:aminomethyl-transferring glycine dehydrogenase subunit GcvPA [Rhodothermia bacterium]MCS7154842.1 aminomethyl-transferring glycine dehydrogenase subunit GcvPA [Bacteroidota bacterium]MCX7907000.1 aminomethyl-transferring glycine dehydrogenase subunit GcvPA [Bacteroidota bacterium]MDW8137636.1 aminomethyl-transferring glycine dehydrogenase subunit GcvPA [Bacteroidota bacterium]MDW8285410.1 aminomethyl-transferring glycine dehydrogenase subunit GcvPA [Bacteroidota bacterium]
MVFVPHTEEDRRQMLQAIGVADFEELLEPIPEALRLREPLRLPPALSEWEVSRLVTGLSEQNLGAEQLICFAGAGAYDHIIPAAIGALLCRSEFYTAYTPYQGEVSQGTLQAIYEFQTMLCRLTGMDVANASMYDGASALAEAVLLACGHTGRSRVVIAGKVHPLYLEVVRTYGYGQGIELLQAPLQEGRTDLKALEELVDASVAAVVVQQPNFYGLLEEVRLIERIAHADPQRLYIVVADPISLGLLEAPGFYGADIVVGEGQPLGIPLNFGGPYLGLFAAKAALLRKLPGRLVGMTVDACGERAFVLTLQTREQHIRRDKATSNICTNQGLMALAATIYMALLGKEGLREVAEQCYHRAHYLARRIEELPGYGLLYPGPFFREFVVRTPRAASEVVERLLEQGFLAGVPLDRWGEPGLLVAVTEKRSREEMDRFVEALRALS